MSYSPKALAAYEPAGVVFQPLKLAWAGARAAPKWTGQPLALAVEAAGQSEIHPHRLAVGAHHDVARLEVAVDRAALVQGVEGQSEFAHQGGGPSRRPRTVRGHQFDQGDALDIGHDEEGDAAGLADVVDRAQVGMLDGGGETGLALEALAHGGVLVAGAVRHLEGDVAAEVGVFGQVDGAHPAGAEFPEDAVTSKLLQQFLAHGHCHLEGENRIVRHPRVYWKIPARGKEKEPLSEVLR